MIKFNLVKNYSQYDAEAMISHWEEVIATGLANGTIFESTAEKEYNITFCQLPKGHTHITRTDSVSTDLVMWLGEPGKTESPMVALDSALNGKRLAGREWQVGVCMQVLSWLHVNHAISMVSNKSRSMTRFWNSSLWLDEALKTWDKDVEIRPDSKEAKATRKKFVQSHALEQKSIAQKTRLRKDMQTFQWLVPHLQKIEKAMDKLNPKLQANGLPLLTIRSSLADGDTKILIDDLKWLIATLEKE